MLVGEGTAECRQLAGKLARGGAGGDRATRGEGEGGICDEKVGFAYSLVDRAGPSPLFSRPESPSTPRGAGDGQGSPDGLRPYSGGKRGTRGAAGPNYAVRMKKRASGGLVGETAGDALTSWNEELPFEYSQRQAKP
jgi:hypothetical protein